MTWLKGGPFLEVSILFKFYSDRPLFIDNILHQLKDTLPTIEFAVSNDELKDKIIEFVKGYPDDETDPSSKTYHSTQIPVFVDIDEKRKSTLSFDQISEELIAVDFWFYGSEHDAPEWNQKGITIKQLPLFKQFLITLADNTDYVFATLGYEVSVTDLFDTSEGWPDKTYNLNNIKKEAIPGETLDYFEIIVFNTSYSYLIDTGQSNPMGQKLIFENRKYNS
jgi:hypothetical protein